MLYPFKMVAEKSIFIFGHFDFGKKFENHFPKGILHEFWFIVRQHKYIYIAEIKIGNFYSQATKGQNIFFRKEQNAYLC